MRPPQGSEVGMHTSVGQSHNMLVDSEPHLQERGFAASAVVRSSQR